MLAALSLWSDGFPDDFVGKALRSRVCFHYIFNAVKSDKEYSGNGRVTVQDNAYILESDELSVYDDLNSNWNVNHSSKEVVVECSNPVNVFRSPESVLALLGLNPKRAGVKVSVDGSGEGFLLEAVLADGMKISVRAYGVQFQKKGPLSEFSFDTSSLPGEWMVTDLR